MDQQRWEEPEKRREEKRREEKKKEDQRSEDEVRRKKSQVVEKVGKSRKIVFSQ